MKVSRRVQLVILATCGFVTSFGGAHRRDEPPLVCRYAAMLAKMNLPPD